jgi:hypothetical protein
MRANFVLRHSSWDAILIALSIAHLVLLLNAPSIPLIAAGVWWNSNTISHNFIHLPFFRSTLWNRVYSLYLSMLLGIPQALWRQYHLAHHRGQKLKLATTPSLIFETAAVISLWGVLAIYNPRFFWFVYLPGYLTGLGLCFIHGYFEHVRGTTSHYGALYNLPFFNDGYHVEHHSRPGEHWSRLPQLAANGTRVSSWPAVLRWMEAISIESLERMVLHSIVLQGFLLKTHERALKKLLPRLSTVQTVTIVGGGLFPRTAILLRRLIPSCEITIVDANPENIERSRRFLDRDTRIVQRVFTPAEESDADLLVIPLAFVGDRRAIYRKPSARTVLVHDWIWSIHEESVLVSVWLLKRMNLVRRNDPVRGEFRAG